MTITDEEGAAVVVDFGNELSHVVVALMKGIVTRGSGDRLWQSLLLRQSAVRDYIMVIGLELIVDDGEGFAYLRQRQNVDTQTELPRLIARR